MYILKILQIVLSIILTALILMQGKGGGLVSSVGGAFSMYRSKRGFEKIVFIATIVFSILVVINSLLIVMTS